MESHVAYLEWFSIGKLSEQS